MATVHVFVGQCGNQLGPTVLDLLASEAHGSGAEDCQARVSAAHFRRDPADGPGPPRPRCVMVDMEPKAMASAIARVNGRGGEEREGAGAATDPARIPPLYRLSARQCVGRGEGSGNNWAYGYHHQGRSRRAEIAEGLRREAEASEAGVDRLHVVHSAAGGTGSGVGCVVAEVAAEEFPRAALVHSIVWPFPRGEVVPQWVNLALCLATLRDVVDGAFLAFNGVIGEDLLRAQRSLELPRAGGAGEEEKGAIVFDAVSFDTLNVRIGRLLVPLFLPQWLYEVPSPLRDLSKNRIVTSQAVKKLRARNAKEEGEAPRRLRYSSYDDVLESLCLDPAMKFFTGVQLPQERITGHPTSTTWSSVLLEAVRTLDGMFTCEGVFSAPLSFPPTSSSLLSCAPFAMASRSCLWALRGYDARREGLRELRDLMASRLPDGAFPLTTLLVSSLEKNDATWYPRFDHEVSLYGHAPTIPHSIAEALRKVEDQLHVGAFIHHFERYGVEKATIEEATMKLWDTVAAYDPSLIYS